MGGGPFGGIFYGQYSQGGVPPVVIAFDLLSVVFEGTDQPSVVEAVDQPGVVFEGYDLLEGKD